MEEAELYPRQLGEFQECFVTNSLMGVMPVRQLGERVFPSRETADRLRAAYQRDMVSSINKKRDLFRQVSVLVYLILFSRKKSRILAR